MEASHKTCSVCGVEKPLDAFYRMQRGLYGRRSNCKLCCKIRDQHGRSTPEGHAKYQEKWKRLDERRKGDPEYNEKRREYVRLRRVAGVLPKERERRHATRYREAYPEKEAAKRAINRAIKRGELQRPEVCVGCGAPDRKGIDGRTTIHAHHDDYSKPLEVQWLCSLCHSAVHNEDRSLPTTEGE